VQELNRYRKEVSVRLAQASAGVQAQPT
jgi:hypothetical protein